jgi:hypothetical protein
VRDRQRDLAACGSAAVVLRTGAVRGLCGPHLRATALAAAALATAALALGSSALAPALAARTKEPNNVATHVTVAHAPAACCHCTFRHREVSTL